MIDESDFLDPAVSYTQSSSLASGARIPEFFVRQLLGAELRHLRENIDQPDGVLDELFRMYGAEALRQIKGFIREHPNIRVQVNWPREGQSLPWICVVNQGESEDREFAFLGDRGGIARTGQLSGGRPTLKAQYVLGERRNLDVIVCTMDPDLTMFLHYIVKRTILVNKTPLTEFVDIQNLVLSGRDLQGDGVYLPTFGYTKSVSLQFQTTFDYNGAEASGALVSVGLRVDALADGVLATSEVPEE